MTISIHHSPTATVNNETNVARAEADRNVREIVRHFNLTGCKIEGAMLRAFILVVLEAVSPVPSSEEAANSDTPDGISLIAAERKRQVEVRNWTASHDDDHRSGELAKVAAAVAVHHTDATVSDPGMELDDPWGILSKHDNSRNPIRCLTIAGALIAAEIDRLNRAARVQGENSQ